VRWKPRPQLYLANSWGNCYSGTVDETLPAPFQKSGGWVDAPTWRRDRLLSGNRVIGPALIEEYASTTVLAPGDRMSVDRFGNLVIEIDHD